MTLCPIAVVVGCQKCPAFKICPLKTLLGDQPKVSNAMPEVKAQAKPPAKRAAKPRPAASRKKK
jgi:hypothetical protein